MRKKKQEKILIGTTDFINIPEAGLSDLPCKIDTGAETSAIHCARIRMREINGEDMLCFWLLDPKHPHYNRKEIQTKDFVEKKIRSSFGDYEFRYQVKLTIEVMGKKFKASFTLSNREHMKFPVLLGKRFLKNRFIVDVSRKDISKQIVDLSS